MQLTVNTQYGVQQNVQATWSSTFFLSVAFSWRWRLWREGSGGGWQERVAEKSKQEEDGSSGLSFRGFTLDNIFL
jgi:hypothetical protein